MAGGYDRFLDIYFVSNADGIFKRGAQYYIDEVFNNSWVSQQKYRQDNHKHPKGEPFKDLTLGAISSVSEEIKGEKFFKVTLNDAYKAKTDNIGADITYIRVLAPLDVARKNNKFNETLRKALIWVSESTGLRNKIRINLHGYSNSNAVTMGNLIDSSNELTGKELAKALVTNGMKSDDTTKGLTTINLACCFVANNMEKRHSTNPLNASSDTSQKGSVMSDFVTELKGKNVKAEVTAISLAAADNTLGYLGVLPKPHTSIGWECSNDVTYGYMLKVPKTLLINCNLNNDNLEITYDSCISEGSYFLINTKDNIGCITTTRFDRTSWAIQNDVKAKKVTVIKPVGWIFEMITGDICLRGTKKIETLSKETKDSISFRVTKTDAKVRETTDK